MTAPSYYPICAHSKFDIPILPDKPRRSRLNVLSVSHSISHILPRISPSLSLSLYSLQTYERAQTNIHFTIFNSRRRILIKKSTFSYFLFLLSFLCFQQTTTFSYLFPVPYDLAMTSVPAKNYRPSSLCTTLLVFFHLFPSFFNDLHQCPHV